MRRLKLCQASKVYLRGGRETSQSTKSKNPKAFTLDNCLHHASGDYFMWGSEKERKAWKAVPEFSTTSLPLPPHIQQYARWHIFSWSALFIGKWWKDGQIELRIFLPHNFGFGSSVTKTLHDTDQPQRQANICHKNICQKTLHGMNHWINLQA